MELAEAKEKFIQSWGNLGSNWGVNKTMAQIHALFLITEELLSTEDVMDTLQISRGNANMNIRTLLEWGLLYKESIKGERKEFFRGEKDIWLVARRVVRIRQRQELEPMLNALQEIQQVESTEKNKEEVEKFTERMQSIEQFSESADKFLTKVSKSDESWFWKILMKLIK
ncbi:MAG: transcriptional regulator [Crocinitomicaceae bacterium]|nr:transcriptional regulator [Crocinitomicaceae bacterium]